MLGSSDGLAIDIGQFSVKSVAGKWKNSGTFSGEAGTVVFKTTQTPGGEGVSDVHHAMSRLFSKRVDVYTSIPLSDAIIREVNVPAGLTGYEVEGAIEVELSDSLPFPLDQVYFDYQPVSSVARSSGQSELPYLVAASRRDLIDAMTQEISSFDKKNNITTKVDLDAFAYGRLISMLYDNILGNKVVLLVDVGHQRSRFYFFDGDSIIFNREQQIGGKYVTDSIAEIYDLDSESAQLLKHRDEHDGEFNQLVVKPYCTNFAEQLNLALDFFEASGKTDRQVGKIVFAGGGACLDGFVKEIKGMVEYPVEIIDLAPFWGGDKVDDLSWEHFSAIYALSAALLFDGRK